MPKYSEKQLEVHADLRVDLFTRHYPSYGQRLELAHDIFINTAEALIEKGYADFKSAYPDTRHCKAVYRINVRSLHKQYSVYCSAVDQVIVEMRKRWCQHGLEIKGVEYHDVHEAIETAQYLLLQDAANDHHVHRTILHTKLNLRWWQRVVALFTH